MTNQKEKAEKFKALHEREGAFVIPNPWDAGSARLLAGLGFEALATTSAGFANSLGRLDGHVTRDEAVEHCRALCAAVGLPVSADLENCFADEPKEAAATILAGAEAGLVGGSIEDYSGEPSKPIYDFGLAVERVHAAAEAAHSLEFHFMLTARAENFLHDRRDLDDTIRRLQAFEAAGADVLYAPGLKTLDEVRLVAGALSKPLNVLGPLLGRVTVAELADAGAKRISLGGALARAAITALMRASAELRGQGSFGWASGLATTGEVATLLSD
ncbi:MAG TPA: isocitrate lyase/phosphoenolpyruvate mutase family protein [Pyrinomonadaceae bacterium]|jgi:2-methylisocitrate lyase-like PEP mutase family enzyme|nr:isocitrate lyase/phosphoenolpyruvate mutase family protein [Pyrinomonadaceae bacterium]